MKGKKARANYPPPPPEPPAPAPPPPPNLSAANGDVSKLTILLFALNDGK